MKTKEINGKHYIDAKIVMLQSNKPSYLQIIQKDILTRKKGILEIHDSPWSDVDNDFKPQHLYVLSNDEIREGDYYLCLHDLVVFKASWNNDEFKDPNILKTNKKIIATTDKSLNKSIEMSGRKAKEAFNKILPNIPKEFIEKYVEYYNSGNKITDVLVEYEIGFNGVNLSKDGIKNINTPSKIKVDENDELIITTRLIEFLKKYPKECIGENKWKELAKIGTPEKWMEVYTHYQELLLENDTREFLENIPKKSWDDIYKDINTVEFNSKIEVFNYLKKHYYAPIKINQNC